MPQLFDAHCHLQNSALKDSIVPVMARAKASGIDGFMCCGTSQDDWEDVAYLASRITGIHPGFGLHPRLITLRYEIWSEKLVNYLVRFPTSGIGEIGLDHTLPPSTFPDQERAFGSQLQMAQQLGRPVSICCQNAWEALCRILDKIGPLPAGGVIRGYTGAADLAPRIEQYGLHLSFTDWICYWHNKDVRAAVARVSADRLLIESDTQNTVLPGMPGKVHEPTVLQAVCKAVAEIRGITEDEAAQTTHDNAQRLFCPPRDENVVIF
jgi:TatD DNase family protein